MTHNDIKKASYKRKRPLKRIKMNMKKYIIPVGMTTVCRLLSNSVMIVSIKVPLLAASIFRILINYSIYKNRS